MDDEQQALNDEGRTQWNRKAAFWDEMHGDAGNSFHRTLISPAVESLLALQRGERVLDVACGSGALARRMAQLGARVIAVDFSEELIRRAKARGGRGISYAVVDATDEHALAALGTFDAITCTMALMDMTVIAPLLRAAARMLGPGGRFVFATAHPAFNSTNPRILAEMADIDGDLHIQHALKISAYFGIPPSQAVGAPDEPGPHNYYHRTLEELLGTAFAAGFVLDALLEPTFPPDVATPERLRFWVNTPSIPPVLVARLR